MLSAPSLDLDNFSCEATETGEINCGSGDGYTDNVSYSYGDSGSYAYGSYSYLYDDDS